MGVIQELARDLGAQERTLRRAAALGTLRCRRLGPRRLRVDVAERGYLRSHWDLLSHLRRALRTEPSVRLAILYGSVARGDDQPDSDIDLLVSFAGDPPGAALRLARRLEGVLARGVDVARLERVRADAPVLFLQAIDEGRVIVDRDDRWPVMRSRRPAIRARAERAYAREMRDAAEAIAELTET